MENADYSLSLDQENTLDNAFSLYEKCLGSESGQLLRAQSILEIHPWVVAASVTQIIQLCDDSAIVSESLTLQPLTIVFALIVIFPVHYLRKSTRRK